VNIVFWDCIEFVVLPVLLGMDWLTLFYWRAVPVMLTRTVVVGVASCFGQRL